MNELNISNEALLNELNKRIKENQIKVEGDKLVGKSEKRDNEYYAISLNINIGKLVNEVISELREERDLIREEKEWQEKKYKKRLETLKSGK